MAAQTHRVVILRQTGRILLWLVAGLLSLVTAFLLAAWIGSSIPRNSDWTEPADGIPIMVASNGVHTELVLPVVTPVKDWRTTFPSAGQPRPRDGWMPTHIAIGWGEREVFLNTPTWGDLKLSTAIRIATRGGEGLVRVGHYVNPQPSEYYRTIRLRPAEYARLVDRVETLLPPQPSGMPRRSRTGFDPTTLNYDATGRYTLANTCNQWTNDTLAYAGVRIGVWTPLAGGVMKWIPQPER
ncbi:DUF2459 domain-containing protein [Erythrobacter litoralis]|uniref:DUF2459 domain-containing protein n=1 Tax=Erythrobacter litoralis TaxID=39960 RepID=UPI002435E7AB|nr:DUF2459 domain-containing protein [Erythrobacter litoralis]